MSRTQIINAMCDLFGYAASDFKQQTATEIWWYLEPFEKEAVKEYVEIETLLVP